MKSLQQTINEAKETSNYVLQYKGTQGSIQSKLPYSSTPIDKELILKDLFYLGGLKKIANNCYIWENNKVIGMTFFIGFEKFQCFINLPNSFWMSSSGEDYGTNEKGLLKVESTGRGFTPPKIQLEFKTFEELQKNIKKFSKEAVEFCNTMTSEK